jgi:hypothetical protein
MQWERPTSTSFSCGWLSLTVDPAHRHSALPPEYQQVLQRLGVRGTLVVKTVATLPLRDLRHSQYDTILELRDATASLPRFSRPIDRAGPT